MRYISKLSIAEIQLRDFLSVFFSADIKFLNSSLEDIYNETGIDVVTNKLRTSYKLAENQHLMIVYEHDINIDSKKEKDILYKILVKSELISKIPDAYFNYTSIVISELFNIQRNQTFLNLYNFRTIDIMSKTLVSYLLATSAFNKESIYSWLEKLEKLSSTTFEGNYFSTGFVLTRRMNNILGKSTDDYSCIKFFAKFPITNFLDDYKRYWYLADGKDNYFVCDKDDDISHIITMKKHENFYDDLFLHNFIAGQDIIFRSMGNGELSIVNKDHIEIIKRENEWKIRSLDSFVDYFKNNCGMKENVARFFCYYVLKCSQNHHSSIFWIPRKNFTDKDIDDNISNKNDLKINKLNITDPHYENLLLRIFTSDGANIIDKDGLLLYCGAIVKMDVRSKSGLVGTGESAARSLGKSGVCVKVSQDGKIKIFGNGKKILF